ncbi:ABC transporter ATP-binding protein [Chondrinema litorale]|uniref:ABC transporter ATP-binding protein n=1 Tax=Chondrinema litorale TaxID=2994555 RepID=UPI002543149B|nr:ATP-binding cassette domain-containing protein [Chondrinema litorale]UZR95767.1 ATP-binding cassette domain-containing protein [Chondrinema litorale]
MLEINSFKKAYNEQVILSINHLSLNQGFYWIKGENGSGKSTLLKSIAGLIPFEGSIKLFNVENNKQNIQKYRSLVRYALAEPDYPDFLKGTDLIKLYENVTEANSKQIAEVTQKLSVDKFQHRKIGEYSSGMAKKLSIALAFISSPKLILLDEPFSTLDIETGKILIELIEKYLPNGTSFIVTSHQDFDHHLPVKVLHLQSQQLTTT